MSVNLGSLFYELVIEDQTTRALKEAERRLAKWEKDNGLRLGLVVDDSGVRRPLENAGRLVDDLRADAERTIDLDADASGVRGATEDAEDLYDDLVRMAEDPIRLDADPSGVRSGTGRARDYLDDLRREGDDPIRPTIDVDGLDDNAGRGETSITDMIGGWQAAAVVAGGVVGAAVGAALLDQFEKAMDREAGTDRLAAQLGLSEEDARLLGAAGAEVYASAWGDNLGDVNEAIRAAVQSGIIDSSASSGEIEAVATNLLMIADVFDGDIATAANAAGNLMKNGLAANAGEAFDLIVAGSQRGADAHGDLLDSMNEYSDGLAALGLSGPQAIGLIIQGLQDGAKDGDLVADVVKEFGIRAKDGTAGVAEGYKILGLDAQKYTRMAAGGGDKAADALDTVLDKLRDTEDPVARNAAAVALFGTQAEDLQDSLYALDPSTAAAKLEDFAGTAETTAAKVGDNLTGKWTTWKREAEAGVQDYLAGLVTAFEDGGMTGVADKLGEDLERLGELWDEHGPQFIADTAAWWDETGSPLAEEAMKKALGVAWDGVFAYLRDRITDPEWWYETLDQGMMDPLVDWLGERGAAMAGAVGDWATGLWQPMAVQFEAMLNSIIEAWNGLSFTVPTVSVFGRELGGWTIDTPDVQTIDIPGSNGNRRPMIVGGQHSPPEFARGGFVDAPLGQAVHAIVHGGEYVNTADEVRQGRTGAPGGKRGTGRRGVNIGTVNINTNATTSRATVDAMDRRLMGWA